MPQGALMLRPRRRQTLAARRTFSRCGTGIRTYRNRRTHFLKINISLELEEESDIKNLELLMPRIVDGFQIYLRELRVDDLRGSAGMYRLREDLLRRINEVAKPIRINDILFKEMLIQ